jgi:hypothetical protein
MEFEAGLLFGLRHVVLGDRDGDPLDVVDVFVDPPR